jgi:predicted DNA repair protein MutK
MAGSSLLALLDDIATILDDIALLSKVAAKKTAGVLGDDLALNAQQVAGIRAERELPVVWAVALGSLRNKVILVPAALLISAVLPWAVTPLLMVGGAYLCYEGFEKIAHKLWPPICADIAEHRGHVQALADPEIDLVAFEREKIKGAVRTDFVLSAEIIAITLGTVATASFGKQVMVMSTIAILMTAGVYGFVAAIVKLDDGGLYLYRTGGDGLPGQLRRLLGRGMLKAAPALMKTLSFVGTLAMFTVGGGILTHGLSFLHEPILHLAQAVGAIPGVGGVAAAVTPTLLDALAGLVAGAVVLGVGKVVGRLARRAIPA